MNHDKATPRPWRQDGPRIIAEVEGDGTHYVVAEAPRNATAAERRDNMDLAVAAVNAWDDPAALRDRLKELEGNDAA